LTKILNKLLADEAANRD